MKKNTIWEKGYGGIEMFLTACVIALFMYFIFYPNIFKKNPPIYQKNTCVIEPEESTKSFTDPTGKEFVLIKAGAQASRTQTGYHFAPLGDIVINEKTYPYFSANLDDFKVSLVPPLLPLILSIILEEAHHMDKEYQESIFYDLLMSA